jgi:catechol 2,3-dioxygenase
MGHVQFVYFRDPDGHRSELLLEPPHYMNDLENEPARWDAAAINAKGWGLPAQASWFFETSAFSGTSQKAPVALRPAMTLESFLQTKEKTNG